jgi:hypothetical protein
MPLNAEAIYLYEPAQIHADLSSAEDTFNSNWLPKHSLNDDTQLYHYTDFNGLQGILSNRELWFGHVSSLNDPQEYKYGISIITETINDLIANEDVKGIRSFLKFTLQIVEKITSDLYDIFLACFCESGNLLSQWRNYANRGGGYCLGFKFTEITKTSFGLEIATNARPIFLRKVIYNKEVQKELVQAYLNLMIEAIKSICQINTNRDSAESYLHENAHVMSMQASNRLIEMAFCFKHKAFSVEQEWRLVRVIQTGHDPNGVEFGNDGSHLIPYRSMILFNETENDNYYFPLHTINYGPSLEPERCKPALELFLHKIANNQHPVNIKPNEIRINGAGYDLR